MMRSLERILCISLATWRELVRSKILYGVIFFALAVILVASLFGSVTIGDQLLVVKDFGLFSISLASVGFAVIAGSALLQKELTRKTIYNVLSKQVLRTEFILGKYIGMICTMAFLNLLMGIGLFLYCFLLSGSWDWRLFLAFYSIWLEMLILCAFALFFSSIVVTPILTGLFTFGIFLTGRSVEYLLYFINEGSMSETGALVLKGIYYITPHLSDLILSNAVVYQAFDSLTLSRIVWSTLYTLGYSGILLILSGMMFQRRDFN